MDAAAGISQRSETRAALAYLEGCFMCRVRNDCNGLWDQLQKFLQPMQSSLEGSHCLSGPLSILPLCAHNG